MIRNLYRFSSLSVALFTALVVAQTATAASSIPRDNKSTADGFFRPSTPLIMDLDAGLLLATGTTAPGVDVHVAKRLNTDMPLFLGGELGLFLQTSGSTSLLIPVLATFGTEFDVSPTFHPTLGLGTGVTFGTATGSGVQFTFLVTPGARFDINSSNELNVGVRLGSMGGTFIVIPQVGLSFGV
jgi:hypothetical protein